MESPPPTEQELLSGLGQRLARRRLARQWSQAELAQRAGVSKRTIERIEADGSAPPAEERTQAGLADALGET